MKAPATLALCGLIACTTSCDLIDTLNPPPAVEVADEPPAPAPFQRPSGIFGDPNGTGYTAQCTGRYADWVVESPEPLASSFRLSQDYPASMPGPMNLIPADPTPWKAFDFADPAEAEGYLGAVLDYCLEGMVAADFVPQQNSERDWYHVPMMTGSPSQRREPKRGLTKERPLFPSSGLGLAAERQSFAIGYYNNLGGYTLGKIWNDADPAHADPTESQFPENTVVFKLIFLEYDAGTFSSSDLLANAPEWVVQDVETGADLNVRLLQVDVAVKDSRATSTGWTFGTFAYDESHAASDPWQRLVPVGVMWGNDPTVTPSSGTIAETWLNPARPAFTTALTGWADRLNGPVDNSNSSCLSCHSTAQYLQGVFRPAQMTWSAGAYGGACNSAAERLHWFRNLDGATAFGAVDESTCSPDPSVSPVPLDYSLQVGVAITAGLFYGNQNPCLAGPGAPMPLTAPAAAVESESPEQVNGFQR